MPLRWLVLALACASPTTASLASTRVAVYAIIDDIELEPSTLEPERIWMSGTFAVPQPISSGLHVAPASGHLYLSLDPSQAAAMRADWEALRANAGTGRVVGFGEYWMRCSQVRSVPLPPLPPDKKDANCSAEITVIDTDKTRATPEPYPKPSTEGVVTVFDTSDDICPRFGEPSVQIVAKLRELHSPGSAHQEPAVCVERIGLVDNSDLDTVFVAQKREAEWAGATEALLLKRIADVPGLRLSDLRVECRDTICHIRAAFPTAEYQEATGNRLVAKALNELPVFAPGGKVLPSRNEPTVDYYFQRRSPR
jgi:hypothetical protein